MNPGIRSAQQRSAVIARHELRCNKKAPSLRGTKQSRYGANRRVNPDCFAALAMTMQLVSARSHAARGNALQTTQNNTGEDTL